MLQDYRATTSNYLLYRLATKAFFDLARQETDRGATSVCGIPKAELDQYARDCTAAAQHPHTVVPRRFRNCCACARPIARGGHRSDAGFRGDTRDGRCMEAHGAHVTGHTGRTPRAGVSDQVARLLRVLEVSMYLIPLCATCNIRNVSLSGNDIFALCIAQPGEDLHLCIQTCLNVYIHTYMHAYAHTHIHTNMYTRIDTYIHSRVHTRTHARNVHACIHTQTCKAERGR